MKRLLLLAGSLVLSSCVSPPAPPLQVVRFEAEACSTPTDAWQKDKFSETKWNLWSTDKNAAAKWSGGMVLQTPVVKADRKTGEEGAPVLHTVLTGIPSGTYDVYMNGTRALGVSRDGKAWQKTTGNCIFDEPVTITDGSFELWFDDRFANTGGIGSAYVDFIDLRPASKIRPARIGSRVPNPADYPPVQGWAKEKREELLDRGVVAVTIPEGAYISWRLLKNDPGNIGFDVYRRVGRGKPEKRNTTPVTQTTDFVDKGTVPTDQGAVTYSVCAAGKDVLKCGEPAELSPYGKERYTAAYTAIKLKDENTRFQKVAVADLNGDGKLDYVIKYPNGNVDPWVSFWKPSTDTYKLEAYLHDGTYLWTRDLGWSIERGIWYSPYVVADLNGDGKAEVAVKTGKGDPRDEEGKVRTGPEWLSIWNGMTGRELDRVEWPSRDGFVGIKHDYNYFCRNQLAIAYLDGKTPCIIALRGTYNLMKAEAYQLKGKRLEQLWTYSNDRLQRKYWGQGEHYTHAADVDGDGREEVMLGSVMLDDTGCPLWTTGLGHNDAGYCSDVIPNRPGLEIYYIIETRQKKNGMCVADARTGEITWGYDKPTTHVHGSGMCADIDPLHPGMEGWGADSENHKVARGPWLWSATGELLACEDPKLPKGFDIKTVYWDADLQAECIISKRPCDFRGAPVDGIVSGVAFTGDLIGDWREEIVASASGELRVYTTTIPAMDRRVCLLQDPIYRADVRMGSMGYRREPKLSYCPSACSPNINLTVLPENKGIHTCRVVVSAPLDKAVRGTVRVTGEAVKAKPETVDVDLEPGQLKTIEVVLSGDVLGNGFVTAGLDTQGKTLSTRVPLKIPKPPLGRYHSALPKVEAEAFSGQGGKGKVKVRDDKANVSAHAISHWDNEGHWLEWQLSVPKDGRYELVFRYCTPSAAVRDVCIDGESLGQLTFPSTGGFGDSKGDWKELAFAKFPNTRKLKLTAGSHVLRVTNVKNTCMNLDFIAYRKR